MSSENIIAAIDQEAKIVGDASQKSKEIKDSVHGAARELEESAKNLKETSKSVAQIRQLSDFTKLIHESAETERELATKLAGMAHDAEAVKTVV